MFGPGVSVAGGWVHDWDEPLFPEEETAVARAVSRRRREFVAGRTVARQALVMLGEEPGPLPRRANGPAAWPEGITGSITHGNGLVLAAVGRLSASLAALGLDLEQSAPLPTDIAAQICRPDEDTSKAVAIFGAKEAAYKAQFMLSGQLFSFFALRVTIERHGTFVAEFMEKAGCFRAGDRIHGRQAFVGSVLLSVVRIP